MIDIQKGLIVFGVVMAVVIVCDIFSARTVEGLEMGDINTPEDVTTNLDNAQKNIDQINNDLDDLEKRNKLQKKTSSYQTQKSLNDKHGVIVQKWGKVMEEINIP
jgi:hypothetical protein